jgi:hypothetical protein
MKNILVYSAILFSLTACVTRPEEALREMDEEALAVVNEVAQSLSAKPDGLVSSLYDATGTLSQNGINASEAAYKTASTQQGPPNRGEDSNVQVQVNFQNGIHMVRFNRNLNDGRVNKTLAAEYNYVYRDNVGRLLFFPRRNQDRLGSIAFIGFKNGMIQAPQHRTGFQRTDSLFFNGFEREQGAIQVRGNTFSQGFFEFQGDEHILNRTYRARYQFDDVQIRRTNINDRNLSEALSGSIHFRTISMRSDGTDTLRTEYQGRIELNGDGTALIRLRGFSEPFLIDLTEGDFFRPDRRGGRP